MTSRLGPDGQVAIPKAMRDALGLAPGDEVTFALEGSSVRIIPSRFAPSAAGSLAGRGLVEMLEREHRVEVAPRAD